MSSVNGQKFDGTGGRLPNFRHRWRSGRSGHRWDSSSLVGADSNSHGHVYPSGSNTRNDHYRKLPAARGTQQFFVFRIFDMRSTSAGVIDNGRSPPHCTRPSPPPQRIVSSVVPRYPPNSPRPPPCGGPPAPLWPRPLPPAAPAACPYPQALAPGRSTARSAPPLSRRAAGRLGVGQARGGVGPPVPAVRPALMRIARGRSPADARGNCTPRGPGCGARRMLPVVRFAAFLWELYEAAAGALAPAGPDGRSSVIGRRPGPRAAGRVRRRAPRPGTGSPRRAATSSRRRSAGRCGRRRTVRGRPPRP